MDKNKELEALVDIELAAFVICFDIFMDSS